VQYLPLALLPPALALFSGRPLGRSGV